MRMLRDLSCAALVFQSMLLTGVLAEAHSRDQPVVPILQVDLRRYGYSLPKFPEMVAIFADVGSHLAILTEDRAIVYHRLPDELNVIDSPGTLLAYTIDLASGALIRKQQWRTVANQNFATDTEPRIEPMDGGRYLVMAGGFLYLYDFDGNLQTEKPLGAGIWAVQAVENGHLILVRHGRVGQWTTYNWLDSRTLEPKARFLDTDLVRYLTRMQGAGEWLLFPREEGIYGISPDGQEHLVCSEAYCRWRNGFPAAPNSDGSMISSRSGLGALNLEKGVTWFRPIRPDAGLDRVRLGKITSSRDGSRVAVGVFRGSQFREFDGIRLRQNEEIFVFRVDDGKQLTIVPYGADESELTPSGQELVNVVGVGLEIYAIP
jgi:hypothetical protein